MSPTAAEEPTADELRLRCSRHLNGHGRRLPAEVLAEVADVVGEITPDRYGEGGAVADLEAAVRDLLGKPAAVFMPSGTMAQQIALRVHAERTGRRVVLWHPTSHLQLHEDQAHERLHGLFGRPVGDRRALMTLDDLREVADDFAALLVELPQREIGGRLLPWDDLVAHTTYARERGAAVHLDGARLLECLPAYERSASEVAGLFDSVYISLYKGLGGIAGCVLAGDEELIGRAKEWRHRHGGAVFAMWPYAAAGLAGLRLRAPRIPDYVAHAQGIASALSALDDVEVVPDPPGTPMLHVFLRAPAEPLAAAMRRLAVDEGVWTWPRAYVSDRPDWQLVELSVGDATMQWSADEVAALVARLRTEACA